MSSLTEADLVQRSRRSDFIDSDDTDWGHEMNLRQSATVFRSFILSVPIMLALVFDANADLYVSAASANSVMRFDGDTGAFMGNFVSPGAGGLSDPQGIDFGPDGHLYVSSNGTNNILKFHGQTGASMGVFVTPGMGWPAEINWRDNLLYVSDFQGNRVSRYDTDGNFVDDFVTNGNLQDGQSWDTSGDLYVSNWGDRTIKKYDGDDGTYLGDFVSSGSGGLSGPLDNLFLPNGELLVSSFNTNSIKRFDTNGNYIDDPITGLPGPQGLTIGPDGQLYAGSFFTGQVNRYDIDTFDFLGTFADAPNTTTNNFVFHSAIPEPGYGLLWVLSAAVCWWQRRRKCIA